MSLGAFGVGFVFRPLGAIVFGAWADRRGRKPAITLSVALMSIGSLGLAVTPGAATVGWLAPVIVIACRIVQGFAFGGDFGPASALLIELTPPGRRGFYASFQYASQGAAALAAGMCGFGLAWILTPSQFAEWGWRLPFVAALFMAPLIMVLRRRVPSAAEQQHAADQGSDELAKSWPRRLRSPLRRVVLSIALVSSTTVTSYALSTQTTVALLALHLSAFAAMAGAASLGASLLVFSLLGGWLADRVRRKPLALMARLACIASFGPALALGAHWPGIGSLMVATVLVSALNAISSAATLIAMLELFPRRSRALGSAIAYGTGVAFFGGTAPFIVAALTAHSDGLNALLWYVDGCGLLSVAAILALPRR